MRLSPRTKRRSRRKDSGEDTWASKTRGVGLLRKARGVEEEARTVCGCGLLRWVTQRFNVGRFRNGRRYPLKAARLGKGLAGRMTHAGPESGFSPQEMRRLDWVPGAEAIRLRRMHDWGVAQVISRLLPFLGLLWLALGERFVRDLTTSVAVLIVVGGAALYLVARFLLLRDVFVLLLPHAFSLWLRFYVRPGLVQKWEYRWDEVAWLRDELGWWQYPEGSGPRQFSLRLPRYVVPFSAYQFESELDWQRLKEAVIERAGLARREEVCRRTHWGNQRYLLFTRPAGASPRSPRSR